MKNPAPLTWISSSPEETRAWGRKLGALLRAGDVVCLYGELGSGKTCLVQGLAQGLEVKEAGEVKSPTFTLIREYDGAMPVYHFDLFRLSSGRELEDLGYEEYFYGRGVSLVEWAERAAECLPAARIDIHLSIVGERERRLELCFGEALSDEPIAREFSEGVAGWLC